MGRNFDGGGVCGAVQGLKRRGGASFFVEKSVEMWKSRGKRGRGIDWGGGNEKCVFGFCSGFVRCLFGQKIELKNTEKVLTYFDLWCIMKIQ